MAAIFIIHDLALEQSRDHGLTEFSCTQPAALPLVHCTYSPSSRPLFDETTASVSNDEELEYNINKHISMVGVASSSIY